MSRSGRNRIQLRNSNEQQVQFAQFAHYSGPLPHPDALERYNQVVPGAAERIIAQFEQQASHRQALERKVVHSNTFCQKLGIFSGLVLGLGGMTGGFFLLYMRRDLTGLGAFLGPMAALVGVFIYGKESQKKELAQKQ